MNKGLINDVSDTALWVATYRATETDREDSLFKDPLARKLCGERGFEIANAMGEASRYTGWSVTIRTVIIDNFITELIKSGVDTIINLGAGLDTRPYRLKLPPGLRWIEVDYPHMVKYKNEMLLGEKPNCQLLRMGLDLANAQDREELFKILGAKTKKSIIITEGVTPYLENDQVAALAKDLRAHPSFQYWITDYISNEVRKFMNQRNMKQMKNAPFKFAPEDWFGFYKNVGWGVKDIKYTADESDRLGRPIPMPWWARILVKIFKNEKSQAYRKFTAFVVLTPI